MTQCTMFQVQSTTPVQDIIDYLIDGVSSNEEGFEFMHNLITQYPHLANKVLCHFYNIACYQISESCFATNHSPEEQEMWFVSSPEDFETPFSIEDKLPLGKSEQEAQCIAVKYLKLKEIFFSK